MELTKKQKEAISYLTDNTTDYIGYGGAAGGGKSVLGCYYLMAMGKYVEGSKWFIGRDSLKDTRASVLHTWVMVANWFNFSGYKFDDNGITFDNGSIIDLLDLSFYPYKDPMFDRFGSKEYTGGWIEEAQQTHPLAFEVLKTRVGRWMNAERGIKSKILCTFNPKKNWVDEVFYRPFKNGAETLETKFVYALPKDNQHLPDDYVKRLHELRDEATKQRLLYGNFDYDDDPSVLIPFEKIRAIWEQKGNVGNKYISADVARFGSDKAVIMAWDGFTVIEMRTFDISSTQDIVRTIQEFRAKYKVYMKDVIVDEDGVGGGIVDQLKCRGFVNNSTAFNRQYSNLKTECAYKLADLIHLISFACNVHIDVREKIEAELAQLKTYDLDKDGKLKILPKEKIKENIKRSPDYLDTMIMRMWFEVRNIKGASFDL